jgi:hypothetical protein
MTSKGQNVHAPIIENVSSVDTVTVKMRTYYSLHHLRAAWRFARLSREVESSYTGDFNEQSFFEHRAYVTGSIIMSASFIEATVNELFLDTINHPNSENASQLPEKTRDLFANTWSLPKVDALSVLDKYSFALTLAGVTDFDKGSEPFQSAQLLIKVRNTLVHYVPNWASSTASTHTWERQLQAAGFSLNPMMPNNPFFPDQCLGYGCAKWSVEVSLAFVKEFFKKLQINSVVDRIIAEIKL